MESSIRGSVLLTRPEGDSYEIAQEIESLNYHVICEPFLKVIYDQVTLPDFKGYAGVIFTSANAVRAISKQIINFDIPVFCVGTQTYQTAVQAGFENAYNADGAVEDLVTLVREHTSTKPYLYIRGRDVSKDLKILMTDVQIEEVIAYHTDKVEEISPLTRQVIMRGEMGDILFFSKRTAEAFVDWVKNDPQSASIAAALKHTRALCLGRPMVQSLSVITWKDIQVADQPTRPSIINLLK